MQTTAQLYQKKYGTAWTRNNKELLDLPIHFVQGCQSILLRDFNKSKGQNEIEKKFLFVEWTKLLSYPEYVQISQYVYKIQQWEQYSG